MYIAKKWTKSFSLKFSNEPTQYLIENYLQKDQISPEGVFYECFSNSTTFTVWLEISNNIQELWIKLQICKMEMEEADDNKSTTALSLDKPDYRNEPPEQREPLVPKEKYLCGGKLKLVKLWEVKPDPNDEGEKLIEMNLTVESLRLATNTALFTIIFLGIVATRIFNKPETLKVGKSQKVFSIWPHPQNT